MAADKKAKAKEYPFSWEGKDKVGKVRRGEIMAASDTVVRSTLRRQGINVTKIKKKSTSGGKSISEKDIAFFTRQMAVMMKSGVPLLQAFDIVAKGHSNPRFTKLLLDIKNDVETGSSLTVAFRRHPLYFDALFCNLVQAGEQAGILDALLDRLATYKEKILAIKGKIKSALFYPIAIIVAAFIIITVIMIFVIPAFKDLFAGFGADLPMPTQIVIDISEIFTSYWWAIFGVIGGGIYTLIQLKKRSIAFQSWMDRTALKLPVFGDIIRKATIARWTRTMSTMFAAGVPLVEALDSVGGASGNIVYSNATKRIQNEVSTGTSLTVSMQNSEVFPPMVLQMVAIGEESGALDAMLGKIADFFEQEVDEAVDAMTSLMEPMIMMVLGPIIGGIIIAMYLPIFKMGAAVGG
ncbi:type II secretion system F family protein [Chitinimonas sp. BJB300]|uniref:type II secretion system F family protein n=1 Tax=Chitinimonas sp. BJB300 TaxID=1559339 RepID=UPI000C10C742|nr:type II secretion system F family protein [Chitinimonas sp. BJB300]PHV10346.1 type II secretion system protein F [Chitinimonas sp. BJB300]TSJ90824.1 type II secretion system F family protein [Chitinimonas sp. BJB300]